MYGWPVLVHYCDQCNYNTPIEYSGTVWTQEHICNHCGSSTRGADIAGESKGSMNSAQHDELAQLFAQNMYLSQQSPAAMQQQPAMVDQVPPTPEKSGAPVHFASAHYTQTAHVRADTQSEPSRSPPPPYRENMMPEAEAETLRQNSIDPSALLPNQIVLFLNANYEQRLRLLELWRISPPSYPLEQHLLAHAQWNATSVQREEQEARDRYEKQMQVKVAPQEEHMFDTYIVEQPITALREESSAGFPPAARMRAASIAAGMGGMRQTEAEPYIVNGYEIASNKHSVDPVYAAGLWGSPGYAQAVHQQQSTMEDQYGMYEQIRNHADWERINEQVARERFMSVHGPASMDDEMVM